MLLFDEVLLRLFYNGSPNVCFQVDTVISTSDIWYGETAYCTCDIIFKDIIQ